MRDESRTLAASAVSGNWGREFKRGLLALAVACAAAGMVAPEVQAKSKPVASKTPAKSKPAAAGRAEKGAKASAKSTRVAEAKGRATGKADKAAARDAGKRMAVARKDRKADRAAPVRTAAKAGAAAAAVQVASKNRKEIAHDRIRQVALAKPAAVAVGVGAGLASGARLSYAERAGLGEALDPLGLKASVAYVVDQDTNEVLLNKNADAVLPIASITKLMTALVVSESRLPLDEMLTISEADIDTLKGTRSRLTVGTQLSRGEMLHLALMSSENRAANALGRHHPGGLSAFVQAMNDKAAELGMHDTRYVEPTGLSSRNQSTAKDLARLLNVAEKDPLLSSLSTDPNLDVEVGSHFQRFNNTNRLVHDARWGIGVQKTGYISEAGQCLVLQSQIQGRNVLMVFLDSESRNSRIADAQLVRDWLHGQGATLAANSSAASVFQSSDNFIEDNDD